MATWLHFVIKGMHRDLIIAADMKYHCSLRGNTLSGLEVVRGGPRHKRSESQGVKLQGVECVYIHIICRGNKKTQSKIGRQKEAIDRSSSGAEERERV